MNGNEYKDLAMRTNDGECTNRLRNAFVFSTEIGEETTGDVINACLGLSGEVGELNDMIKKAIFHRHAFDTVHVKKEIGDVMWYVAMMCHGLGFDLDEIMEMNIDKLKKRYPDGFSETASQNRKPGDI